MATPYQKHKRLGHKTTFYSPDGYSKIEECADCGMRWQWRPDYKYPITLSPNTYDAKMGVYRPKVQSD